MTACGAAQGQIIKTNKIDWIFTMGLAQSAINDWKQGETNGFEFSSSLKLRPEFRIDTFILRFDFRYAAGVQFTNNEDAGIRNIMPTDNLLFCEGTLVYPVGWKLDPCVSSSFSTQLTRAYKYVNGERVATSSIWDPVTSFLTFGFELSENGKNSYFTSRLGLSIKQIRAKEFTKLTDDFKTREIKERFKQQTGIQWKTDTKFKIGEQTSYRGTLSLFGAFEDLSKWTVALTNQFDIKVFKALGIFLNFNLAYDERQMTKLQYNQNLRFGFIVSPN